MPPVPLAPGPQPSFSNLPPGVNAPFPAAPPSSSQRGRPAPPPVTGPAQPTQRINGVDYVDAATFFARYGLSGAWSVAGRRMAFKGGGHRLEIEAGEREMTLDGLLLDLGDPVVARAGALHVSVIDAGHLLGPILAPGGIAAAPPPSLRTIVLDPGHGGTDSGAENKALGINEKTFTLDVAKRLQLLLEALGYRVVLTRTGDTRLAPKPEADLPLRVELANRARADLFISIHFNSVASDTKTSGTEIYTFAPQFQRSVSSWGAGQGDDAERTASPVNRYDPWSAVAAHALHSTLLAKLATSDRGQKIKHLGVLRGLNCPGVLVESAFLSNDSEARKVATPAFRQKIAEGIADGVVAYAAQLAAAKK